MGKISNMPTVKELPKAVLAQLYIILYKATETSESSLNRTEIKVSMDWIRKIAISVTFVLYSFFFHPEFAKDFFKIL